MAKSKSAKSTKSAKKSPPASKAPKKGVELQDKDLDQVTGGYEDITRARLQKVTIPPIRNGGAITVNKQ